MDLQYLMALHALNGVGNQRLLQLYSEYGSSWHALWQESGSWAKKLRLSEEAVAEIAAAKAADWPDRLYDKFLASGASVVTYYDDGYPPLLAQLEDAPMLLYYKGVLPERDEICLAMIGSRKGSHYGCQVADVLSRELAAQGFCIVSGMARGIDSVCHRGALAADGRTVAVVGSGIDVIYPPENKELYARICAQGCVISEQPLGAAPLPHHFPARNRIISGLSRAVIVVEAGEKSGTLLTVDHALAQNRDVFAVPGPVTSQTSFGTNQMIKDGCQPLTSSEDLLIAYKPEALVGILEKRQQVTAAATEAEEPPDAEAKLLDLLVLPMHFDLIKQKTALPTQELLSMLSLLEVKGKIKQLPGNYYQKVIRKL